MSRLRCLSMGSVGLLICSGLWANAVPVAVSPGSTAGFAEIAYRCPTFSWGEVEGARAYELVLYSVGTESGDGVPPAGYVEDLEISSPVLRMQLPGRASSWTPAIGQCLVPGERYAWSVRSLGEEGEGEWSETRLFGLGAAPSVGEVQEALRLLQQYVAGGGSSEELNAAQPATRGPEATPGSEAKRAARLKQAGEVASLTLPGVAAILSEQTDPTGETYGVHGVSHSSTAGSLGVVGEATAVSGEVFGIGGVTASPQGAGVGAFNSADGPDLQLVSETADSAFLTEAGLDRPSSSDVIFEFENSDTGSMTLHTDRLSASGPTFLATGGGATTVGGALSVTGATTLSGAVTANSLDTPTAGTLTLGGTNATSVTIGTALSALGDVVLGDNPLDKLSVSAPLWFGGVNLSGSISELATNGTFRAQGGLLSDELNAVGSVLTLGAGSTTSVQVSSALTAGNGVLSRSLDTPSAGTLTLGGTNASAVVVGSSITLPSRRVTDNVSAQVDDGILFADAFLGSVNLTLPAAGSGTVGRTYYVCAVDVTNTVSILANGTDSINGSGSVSIDGANDCVMVVGVALSSWIAVEMPAEN